MAEIAASGHPNDRRALWTRLDDLRAAVAAQAALSLPERSPSMWKAISGQHGIRLEALLARTGLNGRDPIYGTTAARMLGVSPARIDQIQDAPRAQPVEGLAASRRVDAAGDGCRSVSAGPAGTPLPASKRLWLLFSVS